MFSKTVGALTEILNTQSDKIEVEKLRVREEMSARSSIRMMRLKAGFSARGIVLRCRCGRCSLSRCSSCWHSVRRSVCLILQAIGQRNRKDTESETRKRRQQELQFLIAQKQSELQRLHDQHDSLLKVEQEQKVLMEKLNKH